MELMQLEMFVAVVEERSVHKAANRVCRTQPAVSIALAKLEDDLGSSLLDRSQRRNYRLTEAGKLFYEYASQMVALRNEVRFALSGLAPEHTGRLSIGVDGGASMLWVSRYTIMFNKLHPNVRMEMLSEGPDKLFCDMTEHRIDIAVLSISPTTNQSKANVVLTSLAGIGGKGSICLLQHRVGRSHTVKIFETMIISSA